MTPDIVPDPSGSEAAGLASRIRGVVYGAACGDALGGPLEGLDHREIARRVGRPGTMTPYGKPPAEHAQFDNTAGAVTDDTRLHLVTIDAIVRRGGDDVAAGDLALAIDRWRDAHRGEIERAFIEEYHYAALYGPSKAPWGGHATNGAIMSNHAVGVLHACDPDAAFRTAYELAYLSDGYGREAAAIHAAAVACAFRPSATPRDVVDEALAAADRARRDGPHWRGTVERHAWARFEGRPNHELIAAARDLIERHPRGDVDPAEVYDALYGALDVTPVGSDAGQTLAVALAMLLWTDGDPEETIVACVAYGRDNDSYASVAGALVGALHGVDRLPEAWREAVDAANPGMDLGAAAQRLTDVVRARQAKRRSVSDALQELGA